ncbi:MAG TPA: SDR family oxidoreductase [Gemmataceae bacterium]|jgi:NAD(P)-dependent dehydrogenase (short-subunit alcohol dehydrogenase family)|nr:SDR family oxidoreductase [Gemmataceae bacterium]
MTTVLITGANRGLGLEFTRQFLGTGWRVFAGCRNPGEAKELQAVAAKSQGTVTVHCVDVKDFGQIDALAHELRDQSIDVLLNNAGVYGPQGARLGQMDYAAWEEVLKVNTLAPYKMAESFLENVARSQKKVIVGITSELGSIGHNETGGHVIYRSSKAALNMAMKTLAIEVRKRGIIVAVLHPGWVQTDMGGPQAPLKPADSIRGMLKVINALRLQDTGKFFGHDGKEIPW